MASKQKYYLFFAQNDLESCTKRFDDYTSLNSNNEKDNQKFLYCLLSDHQTIFAHVQKTDPFFWFSDTKNHLKEIDN